MEKPSRVRPQEVVFRREQHKSVNTTCCAVRSMQHQRAVRKWQWKTPCSSAGSTRLPSSLPSLPLSFSFLLPSLPCTLFSFLPPFFPHIFIDGLLPAMINKTDAFVDNRCKSNKGDGTGLGRRPDLNS